jgi:hypothetical protein
VGTRVLGNCCHKRGCRMRSPEVQFNPDERALLDLLHAKAAPDGCVRAWDSELISDLKLAEEEIAKRFFAPKMRLIAAGAIGLYIGADAVPVMRLNARECPNRIASKRYVFAIIPLENIGEIRKVIRKRRAQALAKQPTTDDEQAGGEQSAAAVADSAIDGNSAEPGTIVKSAAPPLASRAKAAWRERAEQRGMKHLGVHPVEEIASGGPQLAPGQSLEDFCQAYQRNNP